MCVFFISSCNTNKKVSNPKENLIEMFKFKNNHYIKWQEKQALFAFSCDFPESEKSYVEFGFSYWNLILKSDFFIKTECIQEEEFERYFTSLVIIRYVNEFSPWTKKNQTSVILADALNAIDEDSYIVGSYVTFYKPWKNSSALKKFITSAHEAGHVLGMKHINNETCIMNPLIMSQTEACQIEKDQLKKIYF